MSYPTYISYAQLYKACCTRLCYTRPALLAMLYQARIPTIATDMTPRKILTTALPMIPYLSLFLRLSLKQPREKEVTESTAQLTRDWLDFLMNADLSSLPKTAADLFRCHPPNFDLF